MMSSSWFLPGSSLGGVLDDLLAVRLAALDEGKLEGLRNDDIFARFFFFSCFPFPLRLLPLSWAFFSMRQMRFHRYKMMCGNSASPIAGVWIPSFVSLAILTWMS